MRASRCLCLLLLLVGLAASMQWWGGDDDIVSGDDDDLSDDDPKFVQPGCSGKEIAAHKTTKWVFHHQGERYNITTVAKKQCEFVKNWCHGDATGMFAYLKFNYCNMAGAEAVSFIIMLIWLFLILSVLASTADNFLVPQLETLSEYLKLSPEVAGLTLLAFGNGAPDIFAAKSALNGGNSDFPLLLCDLLGGSVFISTVVLGSVCIVANKNLGSGWQIDKVTFWRDYIFYIVALCSILICASNGSISKTEPLVFVSLYVLYIVFAVSTSVWANRNKEDAGDLGDEEAGVDKKEALLAEGSLSTSLQGGNTSDDEDEGEVMMGLDWDPEASKLDKAFYVFEFPFSFLRWISIPGADKQWNRRRRIWTAVAIPFSLLMIMFDSPWNDGNNFNYMTFLRTGQPNWGGSDGKGHHETSVFTNAPPAWGGDIDIHSTYPLAFHQAHFSGAPMTPVIFAVGAAAGLLCYFCTTDDALPSFYPLIVIIAFLSTVMWLDVIAGELVAVIQGFGLIMNISTSILGLTVIAIGNSVGDLVADCAVAKKEPKMGVAACFGSPMIMNILGTGFATLWYLGSNPTATEVMTPLNAQARIAYIFLFLSLGSSAIIFPLLEYRSDSRNIYSYFLFSLYGLFLLFSCLVEANVISKDSVCEWGGEVEACKTAG
jgi:sodium/potassium/calcium exchanger 6